MAGEDVFTAMIEEELTQYQHFFLLRERDLFRQGKYKKLATQSLRQTRIIAGFVFFSIVIFSAISIYQFVRFGNEGGLSVFLLGLLSWAFVIASTIFYMRNILEKKKCMERVLKLLEARKEFLHNYPS